MGKNYPRPGDRKLNSIVCTQRRNNAEAQTWKRRRPAKLITRWLICLADRETDESDPGSDRAHLVSCTEAVDCSIPGTTKLERLQENIAAAAAITYAGRFEIDSAAS
jgi:hypothetical protein